jgi:hypothetical protein
VFGGMWGCLGGALPEMSAWIAHWPRWKDKLSDMELLTKHVWPLVSRRCCHHTSVPNAWGGEPFPEHEPYGGFVGQQFSETGKPIWP